MFWTRYVLYAAVVFLASTVRMRLGRVSLPWTTYEGERIARLAPSRFPFKVPKHPSNTPLGGWDTVTGDLPAGTPATAQIEQAFKNIDVALRDAGGKGWSQVFRVVSYHIPIDDEALGKMRSEFDKWMPGHRPIWTAVEVPKLGLDSMKVEIEVTANVGDSTK